MIVNKTFDVFDVCVCIFCVTSICVMTDFVVVGDLWFDGLRAK